MALICHPSTSIDVFSLCSTFTLLHREVPGGAEDIRRVLKVNETEDTEAGAYQFVTVGIRHATLSHLVYAWLTPFTDIRSAKETTGGSNGWSLCGSISSICKLLKTWPSIKD